MHEVYLNSIMSSWLSRLIHPI